MLRRRRLLGVEEVDQVAVDTEPGFHQGGSGGAEREQDQEDEAADRESVAQEAAPEHLPHGERAAARRSEEHASALQSLMRTSYAVVCLIKKTQRYTYTM